MGFSRKEYWNGLPFPSPGHLLDPGIEPRYPALHADTLTSEPPGKPKLRFSFFFFFFWCELFLTSFFEFVTILLLFYLVLHLLVLDFWSRGMWNLSSPNKDRTHTQSTGTWSRNPWTDRGISVWVLIILNHQRKGTRILTIYSLGACHHMQIYPFSS